MSEGWDNATLKKLKALMGKGLSTSEIGKRLGLSKNAVVGKLNRLGWNAKAGATPKTAKPAVKKTATASAKKAPAKAAPKKAVATKPAKAKPATKKPEVKAKGKTTTKAETKKTVKAPAPKEKAKTTKLSVSKNLAMHQRIIQHSLEMANLKPNQCRWPIGDPDSENFHFCGKQVFTGKPYCYEHCRLAYQFTPPKKK